MNALPDFFLWLELRLTRLDDSTPIILAALSGISGPVSYTHLTLPTTPHPSSLQPCLEYRDSREGSKGLNRQAQQSVFWKLASMQTLA